MGTRGPLQKDPSRRARRNKPEVRMGSIIPLITGPQPELPELRSTISGEIVDWHPMALSFWRHLKDAPIAANFTPLEWHDMALTTFLIHRAWDAGDADRAAEIRQRLDRYGISPLSRARLNITQMTENDMETKQSRSAPDAGSTSQARAAAVKNVTDFKRSG